MAIVYIQHVNHAVNKAVMYTILLPLTLTLILNLISSQIGINNYKFTSMRPYWNTS